MKEREDNDPRLVLLQKTQGGASVSGFIQILVAYKEGGLIKACLLVFYFKSSQYINNILWNYFNSSKTELFYDTQILLLNEQVYSRVRETINQKLENANPLVLDLDGGE